MKLESSDPDAITPQQSFLSQTPTQKAFYPSLLYVLLATLISLLCWRAPEYCDGFSGNARQIFIQGEWHRLITTIFLHSDVAHLLGNMMFLVPFGGLLPFYDGRRIFLLAFLIGRVTHGIALKTYPLETSLVGSSGVLYAMFGLWLSLYYRVEAHLPKRKRWLKLLGFTLLMCVPSSFSPHVSYRAHSMGLARGLAAGSIYAHLHREAFERRNRETSQRLQASEEVKH